MGWEGPRDKAGFSFTAIWWFSKIEGGGGCIFGVPRRSIIVSWGLYYVPLYFWLNMLGSSGDLQGILMCMYVFAYICRGYKGTYQKNILELWSRGQVYLYALVDCADLAV